MSQRKKKRLSNALAKANEIYQAKKVKLTATGSRSSLDRDDAGSSSSTANNPSAVPEEQLLSILHQVSIWNIYFLGQMGDCFASQTLSSESSPQPQEWPEENDLPLAQRRSRRTNHKLPLWFQDMLPEPPLPLPPPKILEDLTQIVQVPMVVKTVCTVWVAATSDEVPRGFWRPRETPKD